jgi:pilus assembly protein CpaB
MKPKTLILMVVAVVCGLGASYMTSRLLAERDDKPAEAAPVEKVKLLVAKNSLAMHFPIRNKPEDFFVEKEFVKDDAPKDALAKEDFQKLKGKFLKRSLRKGDHITNDDLIDGNPNLKSLPNGMRAVGIRVSPEQVASGFACVPGSHVDIHWTRRVSSDKDTFTKILLKDVLVLAADLQANASDNGAMLANVVTVALADEDVMKINLAQQLGAFTLVLRNLDDKSTTDMKQLTAEQLFKSDAEPPKAIEPPSTADATPPEKYERPDLADRGKLDLPPKTEPEHRPPPKLKKMTVTIRTGPEIQIRHYWVDENDNVVTNPAQYLDQWDRDQNAAPPSPGGNRDDKPKNLPKDV